jgi:hypothetical protein
MRVTGRMSTRGPTEYWQTQKGAETKRRMGEQRRRREVLTCSICSRPVERVASKARRAADAKRRTFCETCWPIWDEHMLKAWHEVAQMDPSCMSVENYEATVLAWAHGDAAQRQLWERWPRKLGRRPPVASDIVIEVLHQRGFQAAQTAYLISEAIRNGAGVIPGKTDAVTERYIRHRIQLSGKTMRRTAFSV